MTLRTPSDSALFKVKELTFEIDSTQARSWGEFHAMCYRSYREAARAADELFDQSPIDFPEP